MDKKKSEQLRKIRRWLWIGLAAIFVAASCVSVSYELFAVLLVAVLVAHIALSICIISASKKEAAAAAEAEKQKYAASIVTQKAEKAAEQAALKKEAEEILKKNLSDTSNAQEIRAGIRLVSWRLILAAPAFGAARAVREADGTWSVFSTIDTCKMTEADTIKAAETGLPIDAAISRLLSVMQEYLNGSIVPDAWEENTDEKNCEEWFAKAKDTIDRFYKIPEDVVPAYLDVHDERDGYHDEVETWTAIDVMDVNDNVILHLYAREENAADMIEYLKRTYYTPAIR